MEDHYRQEYPNSPGGDIEMIPERGLEHHHSIYSSSQFTMESDDRLMSPLHDSWQGTTVGVGDTGNDELSRLLHLCDIASKLPRPDVLQPPNAGIPAITGDAIQAWDAIRAWIAGHPSPDDRMLAAQQNGEFLTTALHLACKAYNPPVDVINSLIDCSFETVRWADSFSWLPLHYACANGASIEVLQALIDIYPESKVAQDKRDRTSLHFALGRSNREQNASGSMSEIVRLLSDSGAAELMDENGMLPLHYACAYGASAPVLQVLTSVYPESISATDNKGRSPLHFAMGNSARTASPGVMDLLLSLDESVGNHMREKDKLVNKCDQDFHLPLHLLAIQANRLLPDENEQRQNTSDCLTIYLNHKPQPSADFLTALQSLPDWLRSRAVVNTNVQAILNEKIAKRFPTCIHILDGYVLLMIIICFQLASREYISYRFVAGTEKPTDIGKLIALYCGGFYFLFREVLQMLSLCSLGSFRTWFTDTTNLIDITIIVLVFYFTLAMQYDIGRNESFRTGVALTTGVLWCDVISFLKSTLVDFAVFVGGVQYVVRRLTAFLVALSIILVAFAQMFTFIYSNDNNTCTGEDSDSAHCSFKNSFLRVYSMMMGEVEMTDYTDSPISAFLYASFAFLVVILLSNVLIAIVTDSYGVIKNERAAMVFWSNRLDFVAEMDAISTGPWRNNPFGLDRNSSLMFNPSSNRTSDDDDDDDDEAFFSSRRIWKTIMSLLYDDYGLSWKQIEFWFYVLFRVLAVFVLIPLWLAIGAASAGLLWPPQIRERLWMIQQTSTVTRADLSNQISQQVSDLKKEVNKLRKEVKEEMKADRNEVVAMKAEAEKVQAEVLADMIQVKDIMSTLLNLRREELSNR